MERQARGMWGGRAWKVMVRVARFRGRIGVMERFSVRFKTVVSSFDGEAITN